MTWLSKSTKVDFLIAALFSIMLFLFLSKTFSPFYLLSTIVLFVFLIRKPHILIGAITIVAIAFVSMYIQKQTTMSSTVSGQYEVNRVISSGPIIKINGNNILLKTRIKFSLFDTINVDGEIKAVENRKGSTFDFVSYLKTMNVENIIMKPKINIISSSMDLRTQVFKYITLGPENYRKVVPLVLFGFKTDETKDIYNMAISLSIVHLFVISGFHISFFYVAINKILKIIKLHSILGEWMPLTIIFVYIFLMNFPLSASRAFLLHLFLYLNKRILGKKLSNITVLGVVMSIMFIYKPYSITSLSFIFTFMATAVIMVVNSIGFKSDFRKFLAITMLVYLSIIPMSIYINGYFAPLGYLMGIAFTPVLVLLYSITLVLFPFKELIEPIYYWFIFIFKSMENINIIFSVPKLNLSFIQLIYLSSLSTFTIIEIWNLYTAKNNT